MLLTSPGDHYSSAELDGLDALRQTAKLNALRKARADAWRKDTITRAPERSKPEFAELLGHYAAPLSPLRERDIKALSDLFQRDNMHAIEADVNHRLLSLLPEPYWENDDFGFLKEFL